MRIFRIALFIWLCTLLASCQATKITGGGTSASETDNQSSVDIYAKAWGNQGEVRINGKLVAQTQFSSTSQPTFSGPANEVKDFSITGVDGSIGGVGFHGFQKPIVNWILVGIFAGCSMLFYFLFTGSPIKRYGSMIACIGLAILTAVSPDSIKLIAWVCLVIPLGLFALWAYGAAKQRNELIIGFQNVKKKLGLTGQDAEEVNQAMAVAQSPETQRAVVELKKTIEPPPAVADANS